MLLHKLATAIVLMLLVVTVGLGFAVSVCPAWGQDHKPRVEGKATQSLSPKDKSGKATEGRIFFLRVEGIGEASLARVSPDGKEDTSQTKNLKPEQQPGFLAVSPDARQIAYGVRVPEENSENPTKYEVFLKAMGDEKPGESLKVQGSVWCWSPDSRSLAVTTWKDNVFSHEMVDVKTKKAKLLQLPEVKAPADTEGPVGHVISDWSKDGKWLLTTLYVGWKKTDLYRVKSDGSEAKRIGTGLDGKFSPDGKKVLYLGWKDGETAEKGRLFVTDLKGGKPQGVSKELNGQFTGGFCWSPDGKKVAYVWQGDREGAGEGGETFLMVMDADGQNTRAVLSEKRNDNYVSFLYPAWR